MSEISRASTRSRLPRKKMYITKGKAGKEAKRKKINYDIVSQWINHLIWDAAHTNRPKIKGISCYCFASRKKIYVNFARAYITIQKWEKHRRNSVGEFSRDINDFPRTCWIFMENRLWMFFRTMFFRCHKTRFFNLKYYH